MKTTESNNRVNGIDLNVLNGTIAAIKDDPEMGRCTFRASNKWIDAAHNVSTNSGFYGARQEFTHKQQFELHADEPPILAGKDEGANPVEHVLDALAECVTTSMVAHAAVRGIEIESLESELEGDIDLRGFLGLDPKVPKGYQDIRVKFKVKTDPANLEKLRALADFSPVYNTLTRGATVQIEIASQ